MFLEVREQTLLLQVHHHQQYTTGFRQAEIGCTFAFGSLVLGAVYTLAVYACVDTCSSFNIDSKVSRHFYRVHCRLLVLVDWCNMMFPVCRTYSSYFDTICFWHVWTFFVVLLTLSGIYHLEEFSFGLWFDLSSSIETTNTQLSQMLNH